MYHHRLKRHLILTPVGHDQESSPALLPLPHPAAVKPVLYIFHRARKKRSQALHTLFVTGNVPFRHLSGFPGYRKEAFPHFILFQGQTHFLT